MAVVTMLSALVLAGASASLAATVENMTLTDQGDFVVVTFDLVSENPCEVYLVGKDHTSGDDLEIYSVEGDTGNEIQPGYDLSIAWYHTEDYPAGMDDMDIDLDVAVLEIGVDVVHFTDVGQENLAPRTNMQLRRYRPVSVERLEE